MLHYHIFIFITGRLKFLMSTWGISGQYLVSWEFEITRVEALNVNNKMASCAVEATKDLFERYKKFVENNVETVGHLESAARILSYIVPGIVSMMRSSDQCWQPTAVAVKNIVTRDTAAVYTVLILGARRSTITSWPGLAAHVTYIRVTICSCLELPA